MVHYTDPDTPQDITLKNISKSFVHTNIFHNLNQTFITGQTYCIMAPSGAGKTTLFRMICGLEKPDSGQITGHEKQRISAVFQEDRLLEGCSALENIRFVCKKSVSVKEIKSLLSEFVDEKNFSKSVSEYSGGMRRKVCLLRALLSDSEILILDEPFSGLDHESRLAAIRLIQKYQNGRTLLLSSHDIQDAMLLNAQIISL